MSQILSHSYTSPGDDYSVNGSNSSIATFISRMSWSHITQNKWQYIKLVLGLIWLTAISVAVIFVAILWNSSNHPWNTQFENIKNLTTQQAYFIIFILFHLTMLAICIIFLYQYFIRYAPLPKFYSHRLKKAIPGAKHLRYTNNQNVNRPLLPSKDNGSKIIKYDNSGGTTPSSSKIKKKIITNRESDIPRTRLQQNRCSYICQYIFTSKWTLFNILSIFVIIFHLFHVIIQIASIWCRATTNESIGDIIIMIIYHLSRSLSDISPGICLSMYWKAREIYDPIAPYIRKYEKKLLSKQLKNGYSIVDLTTYSNYNNNRNRKQSTVSTADEIASRFKYLDNTKTLAAVHSLLSKCTVKTWLLFAISFSFYHFLFWPAVDIYFFRQFVIDYQCNSGNQGNNEYINSYIYFVIQFCILRPFIGMILTYTIFLTLPIGNHHSSQLKGFKSILSPTIIAIILLFELTELRFFQNDAVHCLYNIVMSLVYGCTAIWCLLLLCSLMALQSSADRQRNRFHGYRPTQSYIVLFEGVFILIIYVLCFGFMLRNDQNKGQTDFIKYLREMTILIFNIVQIFMLFPLRIIAVEPDITKNYFLDPKKTKYITTFKWISLLNFTTLIYSFIFIANQFAGMLYYEWNPRNNYQNGPNVIYVLSYTFTFCMPYFSIWAISQYDKWCNLNTANLPYQESEFSINHNPRRITPTHDEEEKKEEIIGQRRRDRNTSETEMSLPSTQQKDERLTGIKRSTPKTIKRKKLTRRRRQSEGGKPLDMNVINGHSPHAMTPSIPENYDQTMSLFDRSNLRQYPEEEAYDMTGLAEQDDDDDHNAVIIIQQNET